LEIRVREMAERAVGVYVMGARMPCPSYSPLVHQPIFGKLTLRPAQRSSKSKGAGVDVKATQDNLVGDNGGGADREENW
jgi:hypothetical protein